MASILKTHPATKHGPITSIAKHLKGFVNSSFTIAKDTLANSAWNGSFDLVVEVHILQAIPESLRIIAARNMSPLLAPSGHLVCIGRLNEKEEEFDGPPWPLSHDFIDSIGRNLKKIDFNKGNFSNDDPDVIRYRAVWKK